MPRKKIRLACIANDAARRTTLRKRRLSLMKKVQELSILCNVPACAVIYSPEEKEPEIWPSGTEASDLLNRFNSTESFGKINNMMNQEKFLCTQTAKLSSQLQRVMAENDELAGEILLREFVAGRWNSGLESYELGLLGTAITRRIEAVEARIFAIGNNKVESQPLPLLLPPPPPPPPPEEEMIAGDEDFWTDVVLGWEQELFPQTLATDNNDVESQPLPPLLPPPSPEETMAGVEDSWTDVVLGWEQELFPGCEILCQPDF